MPLFGLSSSVLIDHVGQLRLDVEIFRVGTSLCCEASLWLKELEMRRFVRSLCVTLTFTCGLVAGRFDAVRLHAADDNEAVYTDPAAADADFSFQGEYRGWQTSRPSARSSESIGLHVIARGDGRFEAVKYYGGLPGEGWYGGERYFYAGERTDDILWLRGEQYDIEIQAGEAVQYTKDGRRAGQLTKLLRISPTMGAEPPEGAIVLFDGTGTKMFKGGRMSEEGLLLAGTETAEAYQDFRLHGEFRLPYKPFALGQARGNSGFYLQSRYEVQVLDSFGLEGVKNECGALYKTRQPDVNMCLPPLQWQTYDIAFRAARFDEEGNKVSNMQITVWHNGLPIHNDVEIPSKTGAGKPEASHPLPTKLQDHGNPVVYRNLWLIPSTPSQTNEADWVDLPVKAPPVPLQIFQPVGVPTVLVGP